MVQLLLFILDEIVLCFCFLKVVGTPAQLLYNQFFKYSSAALLNRPVVPFSIAGFVFLHSPSASTFMLKFVFFFSLWLSEPEFIFSLALEAVNCKYTPLLADVMVDKLS